MIEDISCSFWRVVTRGRYLRDPIGVQVSQLAECYDKHADALVRFAATLVGSADAEAVVSEAVIAVLRSVIGACSEAIEGVSQ